MKLLQNLESLCTEPKFPAGILWCYGEKNAKPSLQSVAGKRIQYYEGVPEDFKNGDRPPLIILDDLLTHVYSEKEYTLFTKDSSPKYKRDTNTKSVSPRPLL
jgi:hypothetical protein